MKATRFPKKRGIWCSTGSTAALAIAPALKEPDWDWPSPEPSPKPTAEEFGWKLPVKDRYFDLRCPQERERKNMIENRTILLIDDEPQIRRVLRTSLASKGARVLDVASGEEAIELLRRETVDLILLDLNMPGMGGLSACHAIRNGWDVPIIVVSVRESDQDKVQALDAGADDYVSKPFSFDELMARMRAALRRSGFATDTTPQKISVPGLEVDFANRRVVAHGNTVRLTPTEFDIL